MKTKAKTMQRKRERTARRAVCCQFTEAELAAMTEETGAVELPDATVVGLYVRQNLRRRGAAR